jgi:glycosyltransferase involved in cell wall biosynthesis
MRIAMIGQKGLPATHGGVEHHVQQLGSRLVERGHEVVVYTRPSYSDPSITEHLGMQLKSIQSIPTKHLDAITHCFLCSLESRSRPFDIVHYHAIGPCLTAPFAVKRDRKLVATIHGQDWRRAKWNALAALALKTSEEMALRIPDATISVSKSLADFYARRGVGDVHYIPNGVIVPEEDDPTFLASLDVTPGEYVLYVGRLVPEKGAHYLIEAWKRLGTSRKLVVVGDSSFTDGYAQSLRDAHDNVVFTGYLYGAQLATVFRHAGLFVLPSDVEGLPIVLLESLGLGTPVLASDIAPNQEVLGSRGDYFRAGDVGHLLTRLEELVPRMGDLKAKAFDLRHDAVSAYNWDRVADETEGLYRSLLSVGESASFPIPAPLEMQAAAAEARLTNSMIERRRA